MISPTITTHHSPSENQPISHTPISGAVSLQGKTNSIDCVGRSVAATCIPITKLPFTFVSGNEGATCCTRCIRGRQPSPVPVSGATLPEIKSDTSAT